MDPLSVTNGWFVIDFTSFLVRPNVHAPVWVRHHVRLSIQTLLLNANEYVTERLTVIREYVLDRTAFAVLETRYPFVAEEMSRQNFDSVFKERLRSYFANPV